ncbi:hypothetical protein ACW7G2_06485 [Luteimonas sp. A277]
MTFPAFFEDAPVIRVRDGLAKLLGTATDGLIEYRYADAVRLAGHSCPTVAGAWLSARAGLSALYGDDLPERGGVTVSMPEAEDAGVAGVIGQVLTLVTGAAGTGGFKGLGGLHARNDLLRYGDATAAALRMKRQDTGASVEVRFDPSPVPADPEMRLMIPLALAGGSEAIARFGAAWQDRVRRLLLEHADDPAVITVRTLA